MKRTDWLLAVIFTTAAGLAIGIGFKAGETVSASDIWGQLAAGIATTYGIILLAAVAIEVTRKSRAR